MPKALDMPPARTISPHDHASGAYSSIFECFVHFHIQPGEEVRNYDGR
jgi:hypothetical protein